ncbi:MAG: iron-sulfur cluster assembly scaffold protein [Steroidobacteraceae bacterium]|nr:iron-sulfur cluster assembly scaffold protein [Steroidobacteraceae bacterium]
MSGEPLRYSPRVRELFAALPGGGALAPGEGVTVNGEAAALERGAWVRFEARVSGGRLADCAFRAWGCPHTLAAAAWLAQAMRAAPVADLRPAEVRELAHEIEAPAAKLGRLLVVVDAQSALLAAARAVQ